jgi:predicted  nucleic acid-binding Zn-ribbon protein
VKTIELLRELQAVDTSLDADRVSLNQVETELVDRSQFYAARRERDERAQALRKVEADQRDLELEIETQRKQLDDVERKLYGGRVGDAKELTNLSREATQIRGLISTREDRLLEFFEAAEQASAALAAAEARLRQIASDRKAREIALAADRDRLLGAIGTGESRRESLRGQADAASLRTYDNLRRTRGGQAVAEIRQRTCQGCRVSLPASVEQQARHGDTLVPCQSCGRILYAAY